MKDRLAAILLFSAFALGPTAKAEQIAANRTCQTVFGAIYMSGDDGAVLVAGKTTYQINDAPKELQQISVKSLVEGVWGTFKFCQTGAHDRFGNAVVNILSFPNLTLNKTN